jgi:hypothetical protein
VGVKEEHPRHYVLSVRAVPYRRGRPLARRERGELEQFTVEDPVILFIIIIIYYYMHTVYISTSLCGLRL